MAFMRENKAFVRGIEPEVGELPAPELQAALLSRAEGGQRIGEEEIKKATETLKSYQRDKANLESRLVEDELWWELRHWEVIRRKDGGRPGCADGKKNARVAAEPSSAWLFNAIANKHADAMDNYPEPTVLPREESDRESAEVLSQVLPVILEYNDFEQSYSDAWWEKLKHGTAAYGVFWNPEKENGLGDVDIKPLDLLKLFWEPGVTDIQKSRNLFIVELAETELLEQRYPALKGKIGGDVVDVKQYLHDESIDNTKKSVVVDWYYKQRSPAGKTVLHYAKFVGSELLYASENDARYAERGYYDHGLYPVVLDVMFPEKGTPVGFGYVAICRDPQMYIDELFGAVLENARQATRRRYFISNSTGVNEDELLDETRPLVHVEGELADRRLQEMAYEPLGSIYVSIAQMKIDEMKETAANRDVNSGGSGGSVTAAAAIAALQEAGNKMSRDMISASYRSHAKVSRMVVELIRQFYDEARSFRVTGPRGMMEFAKVSNAALRDQPSGTDAAGQQLYRRPVFDLKIAAQKRNPFSRMEQNERAKELYGLGFFNPERAQEALGALDMMDFEGIDDVRDRVEQGATLLNQVRQLQSQVEQLLAMAGVSRSTGNGQQATGDEGREGLPQSPAATAPSGRGPTTADGIMQSRTPRSGYTERLVERSTPSVE